jgi:hypothetical protein
MTRAEHSQLSQVGWGTYWFGTLASRYDSGNAALRSLLAQGLVERVEGVVRVDGDGFTIHPERYGVGWTLTEAGVLACDDWRDDIQKHGRGPR